MDANELMFWLKGHFDLSNEPPSRDAWGVIKAKVQETYPVITGPQQLSSKRPDPPPLPPWLLGRGPCPGCESKAPTEPLSGG